MSPAVSLSGVDKSYPEGATVHRVLEGVELEVAAGEVVALIGRSGSGKTTLLTLVAGLEAPDSGSVTVLGRPDPGQRRWDEVALVPQALGLLEELTLQENVALPERLGLRAAAADVLLERLGLGHLLDRHPSEVSLGEQQRAALARAAVAAPAVLLADEPISHQNAEWADGVLDVVTSLAARGTAVLLATHHPAALTVADRVVELGGGHLVTASVGA